MSYGLRIENSNGAVQVDEVYRNHVLLSSGTASVPKFVVTASGIESTLDVTLAAPIALSRGPLIWGLPTATAAPVAVTGQRINGSGELTGFQLSTEYDGLTGTVDVAWRVTALPIAAGADTWGLRVWSDTGVIGFDSGLDYLRIPVVSSAITITSGGGDTTLTHSSLSARYACLSALSALGQQRIVDFIHLQAFGAQRVSATQTRARWFSCGYNDIVSPVTTYQPGTRQLVIAT